MIKTIKEWSGLVALILIIVIQFFGGATAAVFGTVNTGCHGSTSCLTDLFVSGETLSGQMTVGYTGTLAAGSVTETGTVLNRLDAGTCYIQAYATTIAATSTAKVECQGTAAVGGITTALDAALTGVTTGDNVQVRLATSTAGTTSLGLNVTGASASTTAGYIELYIANMTGATFTWPTTGAATGTASYWVSH